MLTHVLQALGLGTAAGLLLALLPARRPALLLSLVAGAALGVLLVPGDEGASWFVAAGAAGAAAAVIANIAVATFLAGVRVRLAGTGIGGLVAFVVVIAALIVVASLLLALLGAVALVAVVVLGVAARRRAGEKYGGLRILR